MSVRNKIWARIRGKGRGSVHAPIDFLDIAGRASVDQALSRLARSGRIRRITRGVYDLPRVDPQLGTLSPSLSRVASAIARSTRSRIQVSGAQAANALGLSSQVPAKAIYLTDGRTRTVQVGNRTIEFRHVAPRKLAAAGTAAGDVIQAISNSRSEASTEAMINDLRNRLQSKDRRTLRKCLPDVPTRVRPALERIAESA